MSERIPTSGASKSADDIFAQAQAAGLDATQPAPTPALMRMASFAAFDAPVEAPEPITLEEAKAHLNVYIDDDDALIQGLIIAARDMAEGRTNRTIKQRQRTDSFAAGQQIDLLKPPVISIDRVDYYDVDGNVQVLDPALYLAGSSMDRPLALEFNIDQALPLVQRGRRRPITVTYTAGYAPGEVPASLVQWMKLVIGTLYENRETMAAGVQIYSMPEDFMSWMLQPYVVYE